MSTLLDDVCCARLPAQALPVLAEVRCLPGVLVALEKDIAWVRWEAAGDAVLRRLLPVAGVVLFARREGHWYRPGCHLPDFDLPGELVYRPLAQVLTPAPAATIPPPSLNPRPVLVKVVPEDRPRQTTALECGLEELAAWADSVSNIRLASFRAAGYQGQVLLRGSRLPFLPSGRRFWGDSVLVPLGFRPEPNLPASALREALAVDDGDILLLKVKEVEVVPRSAFQPLTRAGIRMAAGGGGL
jgi:hypothetical protein